MKNIFLLSALTALMFSGKVYPQFGAEQILIDHNMPTDPKTLSLICSADIDGNGYADLIGFNANKIYALQNMGEGLFESQLLIENLPNTIELSVIDFNADGAPDLMVKVQNTLRFYINEGSAFTLSSYTIPDVNCFTQADFNNDGFEDVAVGFINYFRIYLTTTGGEMELVSITMVPVSGSQSIQLIAAADGNLDGYADVAVMLTTGGINIFTGSESGDFETTDFATEQNFGFGGNKMIFANIDSNAYPELVVLCPGCGFGPQLSVFKFNESGILELNIGMPDTKPYHTFVIGDIAGLGFDQIVLGFYDTDDEPSGAVLVTNATTGNPNFRTILTTLADPKFVFQSLHIADIAGSSLPDLVITSSQDYYYGYLENPGQGATNADMFNSLKHFFPFESVEKIEAIDVDGNGNTELIYLKSSNTTSTLVRGVYDDNGQFQNEILLELPRHSNRFLKFAIGDINGDGLADIITGSSNLQSEYVIKLFLKNELNETLPADTLLNLPYESYFEISDIQLIDINEDGHLDLRVTDRYALNDGSGIFGPLSDHLSEFPTSAHNSTFIDADFDNKPDFYFNNSSIMRLRKNIGNGVFGPNLSVQGFTAVGAPDAFLIDVNSDLLPDHVSFSNNDFEGRVRVRMNAGDFQFTPLQALSGFESNQLTSFGAFGEFTDLNLDGLPDFVFYVSNAGSQGVYYLTQSGGFNFSPQSPAFQHTFSNPNQRFLVRDLTNDDLPDFITWQHASVSTGELPQEYLPGRLIFRPSSLIPNLELSGRLFYDENENGVFDGNDEPLPYEQVVISDIGARSFSFTDGTYNFAPTEYGTYSINQQVNNELWELTTGASAINAELSEDTPTLGNLDFGFKPVSSTDRYQIDLTSGVQRCGESTLYNAFVRNTGTTTETLKLIVQIDPATTFISSLPEPSSVNGNTIEYDLDALKFFHFHQLGIVLQMPEQASTLEHIMTLQKSDNTVLESEIFIENALCSGTENSISESVGWLDENLFLADTALIYTLRMQNISDAADFAHLKNFLSSHADMTTFELISFTHSPRMSIHPGKVLNAHYLSQNFPSSNDDFHGSEVIIKFKLWVSESTPAGNLVTSAGNMQFGNNLPFALPEVINEVYDCSTIADFNFTTNNCAAAIAYLIFSATDPYIETYSWEFNGEVIASSPTALATQLDPGEHEMMLTASNLLCNNISSTESINIPGNNSFDIGFDGTNLYTIPGQYEYRWSKNNIPYSITSVNTTWINGPGTYKVKVKLLPDIDCEFWSNEFFYNPLNTQDANAVGVLIYPNPADAFLTIDSSQSIEKFSGLEMVNSLGQACVRTSITSVFTQIDTKTLNAGLYTLLLTATDGTVYRSKVLVAR